MFKTISVIGLGYIGLPTAAVLASRKVNVIGVDVSEHAVNTINRGEIHIVEPELDIAVHSAVKEGYLRATTTVEPADAFMIAVPTPFKGDHEPDLTYVEAASKSIAPILKSGDIIILESTSPVGTTEKMSQWLAEVRPDLTFPHDKGNESDIRIAYCPERVLPGHIIRELVENDRVVGGLSGKCAEKAVELYKLFVEGDCIVTNSRTAEMVKLTENSFRDVNIAFANELSLLCDEDDISVWELVRLANRHPRVNILQPGPGVGGHCIAVDPWFIVNRSPKTAKLIHAARIVNDFKPEWVVDKVKSTVAIYLGDNTDKKITDLTVACLGLTFKPDIDDLRESPSLEITNKLLKELPCKVVAVEPNVSSDSVGEIPLISLEEAMSNADITVLLVDHAEFKVVEAPKGKLVDTKGIWL